MPTSDPTTELDALLDEASYLLTSARASGLGDTDALRNALKKIRAVVGDADALAASIDAERRATD
ncbi:MAG: hypothetical protein ACRDK3_14570 [Actinomycetota bacterium]